MVEAKKEISWINPFSVLGCFLMHITLVLFMTLLTNIVFSVMLTYYSFMIYATKNNKEYKDKYNSVMRDFRWDDETGIKKGK